MKFNDIPQETKNKIIDDYKSGLRQYDVCSKYDIGLKLLRKIFIEANEKFRGKGGETNARMYEFDKEFFDRDTPEVAYWAGFIFADGNIHDQGETFRLTISLNENDKDHIIDFANAIKYPTQQVKATFGNKYYVRINWKEWGGHLERWGIIPRKSYNFIIPHFPETLIPHFLRGWFDGDGTFKPSTQNRCSVKITGNQHAIQWYLEQFQNIGYDGTYYLELPDNEVWGKLYFNSWKNVSHFYNLVNGHPRLDRKWNLLRDCLSEIEFSRCVICNKELNLSNKTGYCLNCQGSRPERRERGRGEYYGQKFCIICGAQLWSANKHGYCIKHRDKNPARKERRSQLAKERYQKKKMVETR